MSDERQPARSEVDWELCEGLAEEACSGRQEAWRDLVERLWPWWIRRVRHHRELGSMSQRDDHVHDVVAKLVDKLAPEGGAALGLFVPWRERRPDKSFRDWLNIMLAYTVRDHVRQALGRSKSRDPDLPSAKRLLNEFSTSAAIDDIAGYRPGFTRAQLARQMLEFARDKLSRDQSDALLSWLQGASFEEIAEQLALEDPQSARRHLRAGLATLRRAFGPSAAG